MRFLVLLVALAVSAATLAVSVELITRPSHEPAQQVAAASAPVRQIPIGKSAEADRGDPNNVLSPVYPAAPRKDLMPPAAVADNAAANSMANAAVATNTKPAETTGFAPKESNVAPAPQIAAAPVAASATTPAPLAQIAPMQTATAPNSCAVAACGSAYRSFRASDCTYQPMSGTRKVCDMTSSGAQQASVAPSAAPSSNAITSQTQNAAPQRRVRSRTEELDEVARVVRRLPGAEADDDDRRVVLRRPAFGYSAQPSFYDDED